MQKKITAPLCKETILTLKAGDCVLLSGQIYTARDAAHKKLCSLIAEGKPLPFEIKNSVIYFVGPTPPKPTQIIGSAGPTTSYRMDAYSPTLISQGQAGMIGKGMRNSDVIDAMKQYGAVYFGATGGAGALISKCIVSSGVIAYEELGAEAVRLLTVKDMPLTVIIDSFGNNLYELGRKSYLASLS